MTYHLLLSFVFIVKNLFELVSQQKASKDEFEGLLCSPSLNKHIHYEKIRFKIRP